MLCFQDNTDMLCFFRAGQTDVVFQNAASVRCSSARGGVYGKVIPERSGANGAETTQA